MLLGAEHVDDDVGAEPVDLAETLLDVVGHVDDVALDLLADDDVGFELIVKDDDDVSDEPGVDVVETVDQGDDVSDEHNVEHLAVLEVGVDGVVDDVGVESGHVVVVADVDDNVEAGHVSVGLNGAGGLAAENPNTVLLDGAGINCRSR